MHISLQQLGKDYQGATALDQVTLDIAPGRIVALLGANGAGKTTLLHLMGALLTPSRGEVLFDGERLERDRIDLRKRFALLPDLPPVFPHSTPLKHISMYVDLYESHRAGLEAEVVELLREMDLLPSAESPMKSLSRGQAYKAALCALIAADPELWMFDEPFASGMDPRGLSVFRRVVEKATGRNRTVIYSTQIVELAESFSDEIIVLDEGKLRLHGSIDQIRSEFGGGDHVLERVFSQRSP